MIINSLAAEQFADDLGHFGGIHVDPHDSLTAFSQLLACSDLRADEDPGIFVLLTLGFYVRLKGFVACCFSGRHRHGGFPPTARPGTMPDPRSYRVVIISYPTGAAFDAQGKYALANFSDKVTLALPKEAMDP